MAPPGHWGPKWTHTYNLKVVYDSTNRVAIVCEGDGQTHDFADNGNGTFTPPSGVHDTLVYTSGHYVLTRKNPIVYAFNSNDQLATLQARWGTPLPATIPVGT